MQFGCWASYSFLFSFNSFLFLPSLIHSNQNVATLTFLCNYSKPLIKSIQMNKALVNHEDVPLCHFTAEQTVSQNDFIWLISHSFSDLNRTVLIVLHLIFIYGSHTYIYTVEVTVYHGKLY